MLALRNSAKASDCALGSRGHESCRALISSKTSLNKGSWWLMICLCIKTPLFWQWFLGMSEQVVCSQIATKPWEHDSQTADFEVFQPNIELVIWPYFLPFLRDIPTKLSFLVVWNIFLIFPYTRNNNPNGPNWLIIFRWVDTTNQKCYKSLLITINHWRVWL